VKINLKRIKKIASDDHTTTLRTHDGHEVVVSHKSLHPATRGALAAMPMIGDGKLKAMAQGGAVQQGGPEVARKEMYESGGGVEESPDPSDMDPQSAAAGQGFAKLGQIAYNSEPVQNMVTGKGLEKTDNMIRSASQGDQQAINDLSEHSLGTAAGTVKSAEAPKTMRDLALEAQKKGRELYMQQVNAANKAAPKKFAEGTPDGPIKAPLIPDDMINPNAGAMSQARAAAAPQEMTQGQQVAVDPGALPYGISPEQALSGDQAPMQMEGKAQQPFPMQMEGNAQPAQAPGSPPAQPDPYGFNAHEAAYNQGLESEKKGLQQASSAEAAVGQAQARLLGTQQAIQATQATEFQTYIKVLNTERESLMADIKNQHIDPNRFVNNMSTSSKISTALGLIASGMGSAMAHQENLAAKFLTQQIDNDINAQKSELGKKENLLSANLRQFGNMRDAMDMTRVMQSDILGNQLKQAAAQQQSPMAKANLLKALGQLEIQSAPIVSQMAMRKTLLSGASKGQIAPESVIRMVVPEHEQAGATKELKEAQTSYKARDNVLSAFDKIAEINTLSNRALSPFQSTRQIAALRDPVVASLSKETAGRFTEQDAHMLATLFPQAGDTPETLIMKRGQTNKLINEKLNFPALKKWGIDLSSTGRYDSVGNLKIVKSAPKQK